MQGVTPHKGNQESNAVSSGRAEEHRQDLRLIKCLHGLAELGLAPVHTGLSMILSKSVDVIENSLDDGPGRVSVTFRGTQYPQNRELPADQDVGSFPLMVSGKREGEIRLVRAGGESGVRKKWEQQLLDATAHQLSIVLERTLAVAERDDLQKQLQHADRLATLGQLAAGVAHQLNEPLGNILGFAQLAKKIHYLPGQAAEDLERIIEASLDARDVIRKLLLFARQMPAEPTHITLSRIVDESLWFFESRCERQNIELVRNLADSDVTLHADPTQLRQVLINLVINAMQAMPDGGALHVRTWVEESYVVLEVSDTGVGMQPELIEQIFIPFFTTKEVDQGTGLGLAIVHGIVKAHGGTIDVESKPGKGTHFYVRLPVAQGGEERE
jgi:signal transduction histidine kinase